MQLEALPEVTHMSTIIFLMWMTFPTRVDEVEPPVIDPVIHVEDNVVVMLDGTMAMSRCFVSSTPGDERSEASPPLLALRRLEARLEDLLLFDELFIAERR